MAWIVLAIASTLVALALAGVVVAQRTRIVQKTNKSWEQEREIARLSVENDTIVKNTVHYYHAVGTLTDQLVKLSGRDPVIVQPPDVSGIIRELGDSLASAIYGKYEAEKKDSEGQAKATSMVEEQIDPSTWFPDVEFDESMGPMPTPGGWINAQSNAQSPPPEGQTQTHVVVNGELVRIDGQSLFQAGVSAPPPTGGVE